jgi:hypothetical protein
MTLDGAGSKKEWSDPDLLVDQWNKYEQIAMHFNDLIMRFRTQGLAALTAVSALATVFATAKGASASVLPVFFLVLCAFWIGAWILDAGYYSRMLQGAVNELHTLEERTPLVGDKQGHAIGMSLAISKATGTAWRKWVHAFYGVVLVGLVTVTVMIWYKESKPVSDAIAMVPITGTLTVNATLIQDGHPGRALPVQQNLGATATGGHDGK